MIATRLAHVLFDEAHNEAWTIDWERAQQMQPAHPGDSSYGAAAVALREHDFEVTANEERALVATTLDGVDVLILAHPSDSLWERTTGHGSPRLTAEEIDAIEAFVSS